MTSTLPAPIDKLAIVVVTYKRQELLANLFDSMTELTATPWRIVIVDNENSRETEAMCTAFNERLANLWGIDTEQPDAQGGTDRVIYAPQLKRADRLAVVLGTEGDGLAESTIAACDCTVRIPMTHGVDSLNVAAASAVAFYQLALLAGLSETED